MFKIISLVSICLMLALPSFSSNSNNPYIDFYGTELYNIELVAYSVCQQNLPVDQHDACFVFLNDQDNAISYLEALGYFKAQYPWLEE